MMRVMHVLDKLVCISGHGGEHVWTVCIFGHGGEHIWTVCVYLDKCVCVALDTFVCISGQDCVYTWTHLRV